MKVKDKRQALDGGIAGNLASEAYRAIEGVARTSIANHAIVGHSDFVSLVFSLFSVYFPGFSQLRRACCGFSGFSVKTMAEWQQQPNKDRERERGGDPESSMSGVLQKTNLIFQCTGQLKMVQDL